MVVLTFINVMNGAITLAFKFSILVPGEEFNIVAHRVAFAVGIIRGMFWSAGITPVIKDGIDCNAATIV